MESRDGFVESRDGLVGTRGGVIGHRRGLENVWELLKIIGNLTISASGRFGGSRDGNDRSRSEVVECPEGRVESRE